MTRPPEDPVVERYLERVRASLRGMPASQIDEIALELRGHIAERTSLGGDTDTVLRSLGAPEDLARQYRSDKVAERAACTGSPIVILHSLLLLRRGRLSGWVALFLAALGYAWAFVFTGAAIEKVLSPRDVGLWYRNGALPRMTVDGPGPPGTHEILGGWFVAFGLVAGAALFFVTKQLAQWWIRRSRGTRG
jgi:hypothetical protein